MSPSAKSDRCKLLGMFIGGALGLGGGVVIGFSVGGPAGAILGGVIGLFGGGIVGWLGALLFCGDKSAFAVPRFVNLKLEARPNPVEAEQICNISVYVGFTGNNDKADVSIWWKIEAEDDNGQMVRSGPLGPVKSTSSSHGRWSWAWPFKWIEPNVIRKVKAQARLEATKDGKTYPSVAQWENTPDIGVEVTPKP